jgi:hypothetical protein
VPTSAIRDTIELAKQHEQQHGYLAALLDTFVRDNTYVVAPTSETNSANRLMDFIIAYIDYVPEFIDAVRIITHKTNIQEHSEPFITLAEQYFLPPSKIVNELQGMVEILNEAYLAHRLLEEINDRFMAKTSVPLIPIDMSMSNVLVHSIIGEPFANELDEAVLYTVERMQIKQHVYENADFISYVEKIKNQRKDQNLNWPCLIDKLSINLQIAGL